MSSRFNEIPDLEGVARACHYAVSVMAGKCGLSDRQFARACSLKFGRKPAAWMKELRMRHALLLIRKGERQGIPFMFARETKLKKRGGLWQEKARLNT